METKEFKFNGRIMTFEGEYNPVMVNATDMAKTFGKNVDDFLILKETDEFINACLTKESSGILNIEDRDNLYFSDKSGMWLHRVLALKFLAWLDPSFELFVFRTFDELLINTPLLSKIEDLQKNNPN